MSVVSRFPVDESGRPHVRFKLGLAFIVAVAILASCDPLAPRDLIGLSMRDTGEVVVRYPLCLGESVTSVEVLAVTGHVLGDEDDQVLWRIESDGSRTKQFVVGDIPSGFREEVVFDDLPTDRPLTVTMTTSQVPDILAEFELGDLEPGRIFVDGEYLSPATFVSRALEHCN